MKQISWYTPPISKNQGYGVVALELIQALQRKEIRVMFDNTEPYVSVSFVQPEYYRGHDLQYKIGYTPWESSEIPFMWKEYMAKMQEIWTTSHYCKEVFEANGIQNVSVLPHGINPEVFPIVDRTLTDKFIFLHIGGPTERKGGNLVAKAFIELFGDRDDIFLLVKSHGPSEARWIDHGRWKGNIGNHPRVQVVESDLEEYQVFKLYEVSHCCVYPSYGEGWGLIPWQGIATGLPTITTNATGMQEFAEMSMPLNSHPSKGWGIHLGEWSEPDFDHLCELMTHAVDNWEEEKKKALHSARIIHAEHTWDNIADLVIEKLGDKVNLAFEEETHDPVV